MVRIDMNNLDKVAALDKNGAIETMRDAYIRTFSRWTSYEVLLDLIGDGYLDVESHARKMISEDKLPVSLLEEAIVKGINKSYEIVLKQISSGHVDLKSYAVELITDNKFSIKPLYIALEIGKDKIPEIDPMYDK